MMSVAETEATTTNGYSKCPVCGYWAFNGEECFDCGYRAPQGCYPDGYTPAERARALDALAVALENVDASEVK